MTYSERDVAPGVVLWHSVSDGAAHRVLADGCIDLLWDGTDVVVAGPDTSARMVPGRSGVSVHALRFHGGVGPAVSGVPAHLLTDRTIALDQFWSARDVRRLIDALGVDPVSALTDLARRDRDVDGLGRAVLTMAHRRTPVDAVAAQVSLSPRQLHRRCLDLFGYGPRRLTRILRSYAAVQDIRSGRRLADVAAMQGFSDQSHLSREIRDLVGTAPRDLR